MRDLIVSMINKVRNSSNVRPCVTGHPAWRDAADTTQHNKCNNGLEVYRLLG